MVDLNSYLYGKVHKSCLKSCLTLDSSSYKFLTQFMGPHMLTGTHTLGRLPFTNVMNITPTSDNLRITLDEYQQL